MITNVEYNVPVMVHLDTETGEVMRVVVLDELVEPTRRVYHEGIDRYIYGAAAQKAVRLAEESPWPGWSFGW
jgi:hypothetical protein